MFENLNKTQCMAVFHKSIRKTNNNNVSKKSLVSIESNSKNQKQKPKQHLIILQAKPIIYKVFGTYQTHRLYGDMVFTDQLFDLNSPVYTFQLYTSHKFVRQVHVRKHGIVFEFEDLDESHISSIDFIKSRIISLGNRDALRFCQLLDQYQGFFSFGPKKKSQIAAKNGGPDNFVLMDFFDELFFQHKNDVLFMRGSKFLDNSSDFRTQYLGFNSNMLEWITEEKNCFSEPFISDCLRIFPMRNHYDFSEIMKVIMGHSSSIPNKIINTILGEIKRKVDIKMAFLPNSNFFHYMVISKDELDPSFTTQIKVYREKIQENKNFETLKLNAALHCSLMRSYYNN